MFLRLIGLIFHFTNSEEAHIMFESAVTHSDFFYHIFWSRREMGEEIFFKLSAFNIGATQKFFLMTN